MLDEDSTMEIMKIIKDMKSYAKIAKLLDIKRNWILAEGIEQYANNLTIIIDRELNGSAPWDEI